MKTTLSYDISEFLSQAEKANGNIAKAIDKTSYMIREDARRNLLSSPYKMDKVATGIVYTNLKKDFNQWIFTKKVHAFGDKDSNYSPLTRIFVGSKEQERFYYKKDKIHRTGFVKKRPAIDYSVNKNIGLLEKNIKDIL